MQVDFSPLYDDTERTIVIKSQTPVKLNKKDKSGNKNPYTTVYKTQLIKGSINSDYQKAVNEAREAEGKEADFEAKSRKWGERKGAVIENQDGQLYLSFILLEYVAKPTYTSDEGEPLTEEDFEAYQPPRKPSATQGLDNEVKARTIKLENILDITY